jgi:hypothetical protein
VRVRAEAAAGQVIFVAVDSRVRDEVVVTGVVRAILAETRYDPADLAPSAAPSCSKWCRPPSTGRSSPRRSARCG